MAAPSVGQNVRITARAVETAKPGPERYALHDTEISGFRLYVLPSGKKTFNLRYRVGGGRGATIREPKIGEFPAMKPEAARKVAALWTAEVRLGGDPGGNRQEARQALRMRDLFSRYLSDHARPHKKPASVAADERLIRVHLEPEFGKRKIAEVTRAGIDRFHKSLASTPYLANRCAALLSKAMGLAEIWGMRPEGSNPVRRVRKFSETKRKRFLSPAEMVALGGALRSAELGELGNISPYAIAALRVLAFTGARKGEVIGLQWRWLDLERGRANLPDSKTGEKAVMLPAPALAVLASLPRQPDNLHVFAGKEPGLPVHNIDRSWRTVRDAAGLTDVRIHDLRHSFASVGAAGGMSLAIIGGLLGHSQPQTTARYAHLADDPLRAAAAIIGDRVAAAMAGREAAVAAIDGGRRS